MFRRQRLVTPPLEAPNETAGFFYEREVVKVHLTDDAEHLYADMVADPAKLEEAAFELISLRAEVKWIKDVLGEFGYSGPLNETTCPLREMLRPPAGAARTENTTPMEYYHGMVDAYRHVIDVYRELYRARVRHAQQIKTTNESGDHESIPVGTGTQAPDAN